MAETYKTLQMNRINKQTKYTKVEVTTRKTDDKTKSIKMTRTASRTLMFKGSLSMVSTLSKKDVCG